MLALVSDLPKCAEAPLTVFLLDDTLHYVLYVLSSYFERAMRNVHQHSRRRLTLPQFPATRGPPRAEIAVGAAAPLHSAGGGAGLAAQSRRGAVSGAAQVETSAALCAHIHTHTLSLSWSQWAFPQ